MQGLLVTLNHQYPKWQLDESRIGTNPGVSYRPQPVEAEGINSIQYVAANKSDVAVWVNMLNDFLARKLERPERKKQWTTVPVTNDCKSLIYSVRGSYIATRRWQEPGDL